jgi:hypothetical protein
MTDGVTPNVVHGERLVAASYPSFRPHPRSRMSEEYFVEVGNNWRATEFHIQRHETRSVKGGDASVARRFSPCLFLETAFIFVTAAHKELTIK